eukprot:scaffold18040_cov107-Isochrysis_galbana.AAC.6
MFIGERLWNKVAWGKTKSGDTSTRSAAKGVGNLSMFFCLQGASPSRFRLRDTLWQRHLWFGVQLRPAETLERGPRTKHTATTKHTAATKHTATTKRTARRSPTARTELTATTDLVAITKDAQPNPANHRVAGCYRRVTAMPF